MGKMKESRLTRLMISLRVKKEIEDEFIWEIQMILYNLLVYKTNKKEMKFMFRILSLFYLFYIHEGYRIPLRYVIRKQKS